MRTVIEVIEALQCCDPHMPVYLSIDPEGNGANPLYTIDIEGYVDVDGNPLAKEDIEEYDHEKVIMLWP